MYLRDAKFKFNFNIFLKIHYTQLSGMVFKQNMLGE